MSRPQHEQPYERDFEECFRMLREMDQAEHDALLRDAGILDSHGDLAARYRPGQAHGDGAKPAATP